MLPIDNHLKLFTDAAYINVCEVLNEVTAADWLLAYILLATNDLLFDDLSFNDL